MKSLFYFEEMLTTKIITMAYWLLLFMVLISGLGTMFSGFSGLTFGKFLMGLLVMVVGAVGARIWCELLIVLFKIHDNLKKLVDKSV
jgi:hypothetical protein